MTYLTLETATPSEIAQVAIDYDLYYNDGGMNDSATAAWGEDELPQEESQFPDYM